MPANALSSLSLDLLKTLVVFDETGLVEETARRLGLTQAGVSLQLKKLEEQAGIPLFQPLGRKKALTDFARGLCRSIAPPLRDIDLRLQEASNFSTDPMQQTLRIACRSELMPKVAGLFDFEGRTVYRAMSEPQALQELKEGQVDVVVVPDQFHVDQPEFSRKNLFEEKMVLVVPPKWTEARTWAELKKDPEVLFAKPAASRQDSSISMKDLAKAFDRGVKDFDLRFISEDWNSIREIVQTGLAWAVIPESYSKGAGMKIALPENQGFEPMAYVAVARENEGRALLKTLFGS